MCDGTVEASWFKYVSGIFVLGSFSGGNQLRKLQSHDAIRRYARLEPVEDQCTDPLVTLCKVNFRESSPCSRIELEYAHALEEIKDPQIDGY
jgi:hypothetical protein